MLHRLRPSPAMVVACMALVAALSSGAYAVTQLPENSVGTKQLKNNAVTTKKIKNGAVTGAKVRLSKLGTVPRAQSANTLVAPEPWHVVGAPGQPRFQNSWHNRTGGRSLTVAFYKDHEGIVHLRGTASGGMWGVTIFQLPRGYLPASDNHELVLAAACDCGAEGAGEVYIVGQDGAVGLGSSTNNPGGLVSFDGITFRAAA